MLPLCLPWRAARKRKPGQPGGFIPAGPERRHVAGLRGPNGPGPTLHIPVATDRVRRHFRCGKSVPTANGGYNVSATRAKNEPPRLSRQHAGAPVCRHYGTQVYSGYSKGLIVDSRCSLNQGVVHVRRILALAVQHVTWGKTGQFNLAHPLQVSRMLAVHDFCSNCFRAING